MTFSELVKSVDERLGAELHLDTPKKALEFFAGNECPFLISDGAKTFQDLIAEDIQVIEVGMNITALHMFEEYLIKENKITMEEYLKDRNKLFDFIYDSEGEDIIEIDYYPKEDEDDYFFATFSCYKCSFDRYCNELIRIAKETHSEIQIYDRYFSTHALNIDENGEIKFPEKFTIRDDNSAVFAADMAVYLIVFGCKDFV